MTENIAAAGCPVDITDAEITAQEDVVTKREEALAKKLEEMKKRKRSLVDPLQYEMSIQSLGLADYTPIFGEESQPPSDKQKKQLEKFGIYPDEIDCAGKAEQLINKLNERRTAGFATPKQIRLLEQKGFEHVGTWTFEAAKKMIARISAAGWHIPRGIDPKTYIPPTEVIDIGFDWS